MKGTKKIKRIAVFASGEGSNARAIFEAIRLKKLEGVDLVLLVSDQPNCGAVTWANSLGAEKLPVFAESFTKNESNNFYEKIVRTLKNASVDWVVLAGYMRLLPDEFLEMFQSEREGVKFFKVVNIHPSLLPAFKGKDGYAQAFEAGVKVTGVSVHLVETEMDSGPLCAQKAFSIESCRSAQEVRKLGIEIEHDLYPTTLQWLLNDSFVIEQREQGRVCVCKN